MDTTLAERITTARKKAGLKQGVLADRLKIAVQTLNKYEKGHRTPDAELLNRMVKELDCDPAWLLTGEEQGGKAPARTGAIPWDPKEMRTVIREINNHLKQERIKLTPEKHAELAVLIYEMIMKEESDTGKKEVKGKVLDFVRLAS